MLNRQSIAFIRYFVSAYSGRTLVLVLLLVLSGLAEAIGIAGLLPLLELATEQGSEEQSFLSRAISAGLQSVGLRPALPLLLAIIVAGMLLKAVFRLLAMKQVGYTVARVAADLRLSLIRSLIRTNWSYFVRQPAGRLANAIAFEAVRAAASYQNVCAMLATTIQVAVYTAVAFLVSWRIAVLAMIGGTIVIFILQKLVQISRDAGRTQMELMRSLIVRFTDALQGIKPIKAMAREEHLQPLLEAETQGINKAQERQVLATEAMSSAQEPIIVMLMSLALYYLLSFGSASLATVLVMGFLFYRLAGRVSLLQSDYQAIAVGETCFWSMRQAIDVADEHREATARPGREPSLAEGITFSDVSFRYGDKLVLDHARLFIPAGKFIALTGASGAGKTTVADLIVGLYRPVAGEVVVDGVPLNELDMAAWRRQIGYVPQEMFLFHDSVLHNVTLGDPTITSTAVEEALRSAGAWDFVQQLPEGLETVLGERGSTLSGGQRQRIAIARALVHKPTLLVLDEITTALDPVTELALCSTLQSLRGSVTILSISHQPAMIESADSVFRLESGRFLQVELAAASA